MLKVRDTQPPDSRLWKYAHEKLDGHRLVIRKYLSGQCIARTTLPSIVDMSWTNWWHLFLGPRIPSGSIIEGEILVPSRPASYVKTAIKERDPTLTFNTFAIPWWNSDSLAVETLGCAQDLCAFVGLPWIPHITLPDDLLFDQGQWLNSAHDRGIEGWVFKVSNYQGWWKLKAVKTIDLVVTGFRDGKGKYLGLVGALKCSVEGYEVAAVSGMTDEQRVDIDEKSDLGRVCEVAYQLVSSNGRLRHPRFVRWRDDKKACTLEQDLELKEYWCGKTTQV